VEFIGTRQITDHLAVFAIVVEVKVRVATIEEVHVRTLVDCT
jgi:hypothetical protein